MNDLKHFRFWCQKVLPLVYDDSLSYYEILCKVVTYINNLIDTDKKIIDDVDLLKNEISIIQEWIKNFENTDYLEKLIEESIIKMIIVGITNEGYFIIYIPQSWDDITFRTTGLDTFIEGYDYGHLVLSY